MFDYYRNESTFSAIINRRNIGNRCIIFLIDIFFTTVLVKRNGSPGAVWKEMLNQ